MNLKDLNIKKSYDSDEDDILNDFYIPALSASVSYDRLAGFFSSSSLAVAARGIAELIINNGKIKIVCSAKLNKSDVDAILEGQEELTKLITRKLCTEIESIDAIKDKFVRNHVKALGWMIANNLLEIKIAILKIDNKLLPFDEIVRSGIFHQKIGILQDNDGNMISFSGSDNETASSWIKNIEEFKVFCSWNDTEREYLNADYDRFNRFWFGLAKRAEVIELPEAVKCKFIEIAPDSFETLNLQETYTKNSSANIKLYEHQLNAVDKWIINNKQCIFEMATGTGKTVAALLCLKNILSTENKSVTVISVPYAHLISQWRESIEKNNINIKIIIAFSQNPKWRDELINNVRSIRNGFINHLILITTHDTFYKDDFINSISIIQSKVFLIVDEVHGIGSEIRKIGLIDKYNYRLGLSATPSRWLDPEGTSHILNYFGIKKEDDIFVFSLNDAIKTINPNTGETYLTPYEYRPYFTKLTDDELNLYLEKTKKIAKAFYKSKGDEKNSYFELLCIERQKIIKNAINKYNVLLEILNDIGDLKHGLIYCSPEQIDLVQEILNGRQIIQHKFTQEEGTSPEKTFGNLSERDHILEQFNNGEYQCLVAMKCLDEGIDIPQARSSIILASSGNPREYVQRRGRLLRRFPGKDKSIIYDVIVLPNVNDSVNQEEPFDDIERRMVKAELQRYEEFALTALNVVECIKIIKEIEYQLGLE